MLNIANQIVRRHHSTVYDGLAIRNVAKKIESLYWEEGAPDLSDEEQDEEDAEIVRRGDDLTTDAYVSSLYVSFSLLLIPPRSIGKLARMAEEDGIPTAFATSVTQLQSLQAKRKEVQKKLDALRHFQALLEPIRDPQANVQPNLVTRDGALAEELGRSKTLGIRVAGRVAGLKDEDGGLGSDEDVVMVDEREKVRRVLGGG
jgi:hypothetical protein